MTALQALAGAAIAVGLVIAGVFLLVGLAWALIIAGVLLAVAMFFLYDPRRQRERPHVRRNGFRVRE